MISPTQVMCAYACIMIGCYDTTYNQHLASPVAAELYLALAYTDATCTAHESSHLAAPYIR